MKKLTTQDFINKSNDIHNFIYDYEKTSYTIMRNIVTITCKDHGDFEQKAMYHIQGNGCPLCSGNVKLTRSDFIDKSLTIHRK